MKYVVRTVFVVTYSQSALYWAKYDRLLVHLILFNVWIWESVL